jgi:hypothetical protein
MNHYILEFVNKLTGQEGVLLDGMTKKEALIAYGEYCRKWFCVEVWYGPKEELMDKPAMVGI